MMSRLSFLLVVGFFLAGCTDAEEDGQVAVSWTFERGTCIDVEADVFRLEVGPEGESMEVPCVDEELALEFPLGREVELTADLASQGEAVTIPLESGLFEVPPGGADVEFRFTLEDFLYTADFRFTIDYTGALTCADAAVTAQRITLYHDDGTLVEGAEVCNLDGDCVAADGSPAPCRTDEQVIAGLSWGRYEIDFVGEAPVACYRRVDVPIQIDFSTQIREFRVNRTDSPCQ